MTVYLGQINDFVINKTTPVIHFLSEKLEGFHGNIRPLFFSECEKRGTQLANLLKNPNASEFIATTLKILPLSILIFTICCCVNLPVALLLSGLTCLVIATQPELFSSDGKKILLQSCASAALLDTVCKVTLAVSTLAVGSALGALAIGICLTAGFYTASTLIK
jgi:hypothetical protein